MKTNEGVTDRTLRVVAESTSGLGAGNADEPLVATCEIDVEMRQPSVFEGAGEGIPDPELVHDGSSEWRSRLQEGRWQVNAGHPGYREVADRPALKLRYLAMLLAKEVVLNSCKDPRAAEPMENLIEVFSFADRLLAKRGDD